MVNVGELKRLALIIFNRKMSMLMKIRLRRHSRYRKVLKQLNRRHRLNLQRLSRQHSPLPTRILGWPHSSLQPILNNMLLRSSEKDRIRETRLPIRRPFPLSKRIRMVRVVFLVIIAPEISAAVMAFVHSFALSVRVSVLCHRSQLWIRWLFSRKRMRNPRWLRK